MIVRRVVTWNVLHRVHAVNWKEAPVVRFPDEAVRIDAIATRLGAFLDEGIEVVCLQEASGDLATRVAELLADRVVVFTHAYPRMPRLRDGSALPLGDATELLVTLVHKTSATVATARSATFASDPGKGWLAVDDGTATTFVNTHVSFGPRSPAQLADVRAAALASKHAIVVGDFNASASDVAAGFGDGFTISALDGQRPTRVVPVTAEDGSARETGKVIDHALALGGAIAEATVVDGRGLSDHNPVAVVVHFAK